MKPISKASGFIFLCLLWGTTWLAIKFSLEGLPPFLGASIRFGLATLILAFIIIWRRISLKISQRDFLFILITAFLIYFIDYGFIYWGEQYLSAGVTAIFFATFTMFTALFSHFIFKSEPFNWYRYVGIFIGFTGIMMVFYDQLLITRFNPKVMLASIAIIISAAAGAMGSVMIKKYLTTLNTLTLTFYQLILGTLFLAIYGFAGEGIEKVHLTSKVILAVLYLGIVGSAIAFVIYFRLLKEMSAINLSLIIYITPIIAVLIDFIFFGYILPLRSIIGMVIIFSGIWLTQSKKLKFRKQ